MVLGWDGCWFRSRKWVVGVGKGGIFVFEFGGGGWGVKYEERGEFGVEIWVVEFRNCFFLG